MLTPSVRCQRWVLPHSKWSIQRRWNYTVHITILSHWPISAIEHNAIGTTWHWTNPSMASQLMQVSEWSILTCERHMPSNLLVIVLYVLLNMCDKINPFLISYLEKCDGTWFLRKVGNKQLAVIMSRCSTSACGKIMHRCIL